jgi:hypothetical protein
VNYHRRREEALARHAIGQFGANKEGLMKWILALLTLGLATLALEEKGRQVAGDAREAYGEAAEQARDATKTLSRSVDQQPLTASW